MAILGNTLREKREAMGLSVAEISNILEIQERFIVALEEENLEIIPNEYYIKAFMKQYGDFLKINGEKLLASFYKEQDNLAKKREKEEKIADTKKEELIVIPNLDVDTKTQEQRDEKIEQLKRQQEAENLSNIDKPTETSLFISDYEYEEELKSEANKSKFNKSILIWPIIILFGFLFAFLVHSAFNFSATKSKVATIQTTTTTTTATSESESTVLETTESSTSESTSQTIQEETSTTVQSTTTQVITNKPIETTAATTTVVNNSQTAATLAQEYPTGTNAIYVKSAQDRATTYGLGSDYKNYTGNYNFKVTVTEPTWIRVIIHNQVIYEGTITSQYTFHALNTAHNVIVKTGVASATNKMNNSTLSVPTNYRVHTVEVDLRR